MRFLQRINPMMLTLVRSEPTAKRLWSIEIWGPMNRRRNFECFGSLNVLEDRHFVLGFGNLLSVRYYESLLSRTLVFWAGHRGLAFWKERSKI